jgi:hypothetical protein
VARRQNKGWQGSNLLIEHAKRRPPISLTTDITEADDHSPVYLIRKIEVTHMTTPERQTPADQNLVLREPALLWTLVILAGGVAAPAFCLYKLQLIFAFSLGLPAASIATIAGIISIIFKAGSIKGHEDVLLVFIQWGGAVLAMFSLLAGPFFPIAIIFGLIVGTPWAIWVGFVTGLAMKWHVDTGID